MAELVRGRPALTKEWTVSIGHDLLSTASLVTIVHDFEGLGTWLLEAYSSLPAQLRHDLEVAFRLTNYPQAVVEALGAAVVEIEPQPRDADTVFARLAALDEATCARMLSTILTKSFARRDVPPPPDVQALLADREALQTALDQLNVPVDHAEAAHVIQAPLLWRDLVRNSVQQFWERTYREQWQQTVDQLQRSVDYHRQQNYPADFSPLFTAVTGRQVPDGMRNRMHDIEHVRFVPSLYLGPYVSFLFNGNTATIYYNGQGTTAIDPQQSTNLDDLYHPLTALADKTRLAIVAMLNGRELYAQEIVDRLGISQSAVSRHLQLMVDMKVLNVRRGERGAKFYSINQSALQRVAQRLNEFH